MSWLGFVQIVMKLMCWVLSVLFVAAGACGLRISWMCWKEGIGYRKGGALGFLISAMYLMMAALLVMVLTGHGGGIFG
jgi:hypothetical protein